MKLRVPTSLQVTVPLLLLAFAAVLGAVHLLHEVPRAESAAEDDVRKRLAEELSRLQSTAGYFMIKGDIDGAQHEIAVLARNQDVALALLTDDQGIVIASTRRAWLGQSAANLLPLHDLDKAEAAIHQRRAGVVLDASGNQMLGYAGILLGGSTAEAPSNRIGCLFIAYDLTGHKAEARAHLLQQSIYWAGWVTAMAGVLWLAFHYLLTRRTARLVYAAEQFAAGNLAIRSGIGGNDELGRLGRAFDAMARKISADITQRERSDTALRVSEASYRAVFDAAEDAIFVHEVGTGAILDVNPKACATFGYTHEEFRVLDVGKLSSGVHPYTQERAMVLMARVAAGEQMRVEWHCRNKDGTLRWHEVYGKRVTIGGRDRILSLARDIDDRKTAEAALVASEEQYHAMFNASIDGLALWDATGRLVDTNPALWGMYGRVDTTFVLRTGVWKGPRYSQEFLRAVAAGAPQHTEVAERRMDGSPLDLEIHGIPMQYQGEPHVLTIARDITEKKRSEEALARQRESLHQREKLAALGSLLAGVAHELNNPLSVVVARAVLLEEQGDPATQVAAAKIRTAAERCARIVRTFLAMARQQQPERGPVAVNEVVTAALDIASYALRTGGVEVKVDLADGIPLFLADADQLHQVLLNLLINAQQALQDQPAPRRIRVSSRFNAARNAVHLTVADNGPGVPADLRDRIFEPYFTTKASRNGTGVGLAVSQGIVEAHGGTLSVDCPPRGGSVFMAEIPVNAVEAIDAQVEAPQLPIVKGRKILVVDDEPELRDSLAEILTGATHRVVTAGSGREALERMTEEHFDVILTDVRMPDIDGCALYREIEQRWPTRAPRVVFVTGDTLASASREFVVQSGRPVIEKPFMPGEVRRVVAELTASRGRQAA